MSFVMHTTLLKVRMTEVAYSHHSATMKKEGYIGEPKRRAYVTLFSRAEKLTRGTLNVCLRRFACMKRFHLQTVSINSERRLYFDVSQTYWPMKCVDIVTSWCGNS